MKIQIISDGAAVSVFDDNGDVLMPEVHAELIYYAIPLLVGSAALVASLASAERQRWPGSFAFNCVAAACTSAGIPQAELIEWIRTSACMSFPSNYGIRGPGTKSAAGDETADNTV